MLSMLFLLALMSKEEEKIKSGDKYTATWWMKQAGLNDICFVSARLNKLSQQNIVIKKYPKYKYEEVISFIPNSDFTIEVILIKL